MVARIVVRFGLAVICAIAVTLVAEAADDFPHTRPDPDSGETIQSPGCVITGQSISSEYPNI